MKRANHLPPLSPCGRGAGGEGFVSLAEATKASSEFTAIARATTPHPRPLSRKERGEQVGANSLTLGSRRFGGDLLFFRQHRAAFDHRQRLPFLNDLVVLIDDGSAPGDDAAFAATSLFLGHDFRLGANRVADEDRSFEVPILDAHEGDRSHQRRVDGQSGADRPDQHAMRDRLTKQRRLGEFVVDVDRIEIAADAREIDEIRLREAVSPPCSAQRQEQATDVHRSCA